MVHTHTYVQDRRRPTVVQGGRRGTTTVRSADRLAAATPVKGIGRICARQAKAKPVVRAYNTKLSKRKRLLSLLLLFTCPFARRFLAEGCSLPLLVKSFLHCRRSSYDDDLSVLRRSAHLSDPIRWCVHIISPCRRVWRFPRATKSMGTNVNAHSYVHT